MKLIKGSDLLAAFEAIHSIQTIMRSIDPAVVDETAGAIRDALASTAPVGASLADCLNDEDLLHFVAREAIKAYSAQVDRSPEGQDAEGRLDRDDESAVPEGNAP